MHQLLERLAAVPVRRDGTLDIPIDDYFEEVDDFDVIDLLETYSFAHKHPTLRTVLADRRFREWVHANHRTPIGRRLERELTSVHRLTSEESVAATTHPNATPSQRVDALRRWAADVGIAWQLRAPVAVLTSLARGEARYLIQILKGLTVDDLLDEAKLVQLARREWVSEPMRRDLARLAEAYVRAAGERVVAERQKEERIAARAYTPEGEGVTAFLASLKAACARTTTASSKPFDALLDHITFENKPAQLAVNATIASSSGRATSVRFTIDLEDWRSAALETSVRASAKVGRSKNGTHFALRAVARLLADPEDHAHGPFVSYLNEPGSASYPALSPSRCNLVSTPPKRISGTSNGG